MDLNLQETSGELRCDEFDSDETPNMSTSSRQALKEDAKRLRDLRRVVAAELRCIASQWSDPRRESGTKLARTIRVLSDWLDSLMGDTKRKAQKWVGRINAIRTDRGPDRMELLKASILAFERYRQREQLDSLDNLSAESVEALLPIIRDVDPSDASTELSLAGQGIAALRRIR